MFFTYRVMSAENTAQQEQQHSCVHSAASRIQTIFLKTQLIKIHYFFSKSIHPVCKDSVGQHLSLSLCSQASQASEMISVRHLFSTECSPHTSNLALKGCFLLTHFFKSKFIAVDLPHWSHSLAYTAAQTQAVSCTSQQSIPSGNFSEKTSGVSRWRKN